MDAKELRTLSVDELRARCRQWGEELFKARFKARTAEAKDTSIFKKLRKDIARAQTVLTEKVKGGQVVSGQNVVAKVEVEAPADQTVGKGSTAKKSSPKKSKE
jgi:large subunit ribosomal protein L29